MSNVNSPMARRYSCARIVQFLAPCVASCDDCPHVRTGCRAGPSVLRPAPSSHASKVAHGFKCTTASIRPASSRAASTGPIGLYAAGASSRPCLLLIVSVSSSITSKS